MGKILLAGCALALLWACKTRKDYKKEADTFLQAYSAQYQKLYTASSEAEWPSNTNIAGDSTDAVATQRANEAFATFTGSKENIAQIQTMLEHQDQLTAIQVNRPQHFKISPARY